MFDKQYRFKGKHALWVDLLTAVFDEKSKARLFERNIDVYVNAPLVGFLYGRRADSDDTVNSETNQVYNQNVMADRVINSHAELLFNFQLIMLLDINYEPDAEKRINKALRNPGNCPEDEKYFDSYVRGGVEVLYEKLIKNSKDPGDYVTHLYEFIDEFNDRFNREISTEQILKLCMNK